MAAFNLNPWFIRGESKNDLSAIVFCFHPAGSAASIFQSWDQASSKSTQFIGVQLPGREYRYKESPYQCSRLAAANVGEAIVKEIANFPDCRVFFYGHSYGSLVAFETCRWMRKKQHQLPAHLFVSGRGSPQLKKRFKPVYNLDDDALIDVLKVYGGTKESMLKDKKIMKIFFRAIRADLEANDTYEYSNEKQLELPITAFCGAEDPVCNVEEIKAWVEQTTKRFNYLTFPGGHFFFQDKVKEVVQFIENEILIPANNLCEQV